MKQWKRRLPAVMCFFCLSCLFPLITSAQEEPFKVMFWNVENLFDCEPDSLKDDKEFLPGTLRNWHYGRYKKKLANIAKVVAAVGKWDPPAVVGLCEIENERVMRDLVYHSPLREQGYRFVMTNSPDKRGINVALLYQRGKFRLINHQSIRIELPGGKATRDILHVSGQIITGDTLDVMVIHFPSRSGGIRETEPYRLCAARTLRSVADSLLSVRGNAQLVIMGDFNDYPADKSITSVLRAKVPEAEPTRDELYHLLMRKSRKADYGSYCYRGEWMLFDQIIVSGSLLQPSNPLRAGEEKTDVARFPFLLVPNGKYGGERPFPTYYGMKYEGGFSDHLPVYSEFRLSVPD